jgi:hypothetical protein
MLLRLALEIRRFNPHVLVYLMPLRGLKAVKRDSWFFQWAAGVRRIVGLPATEADVTRKPDPSTGMYEAEARRLA